MKSQILENPFKRRIASSFGRAAADYEQQAEVQKEVAERLIASLEPWQNIIPPGPILEVGCGTGFVTEGLLKLYPDRQKQITDLSPEMVEYCSQKFDGAPNTEFYPLDAEQLDREGSSYALTVSGFTAQWFNDPALTLGAMLERTKPGGLLLASFPGSESFPEWKEYCRDLGLPFTGNDLPDTEEMAIKLSVGPAQIDFYEDTITQQFDSATDFFRHLKTIGVSASEKSRQLSHREMKLLVRHWDEQSEGPVTISYHIVFMAVKRDYSS